MVMAVVGAMRVGTAVRRLLAVVDHRGRRAMALTKSPELAGAAKYLTPLTAPSFLPWPAEDPVNRRPTQLRSSENSTGPV